MRCCRVKPRASPTTRNPDDRLPRLGLGTFGSGGYRSIPVRFAALGYTEGKNIRVLYRFADGNSDRFYALTVELVALGAMIKVTSSTTSIRAAHDAAPNVPIVSWGSANAVFMGWAQTWARPTPRGKLSFQITGAFAEFERSMIRQRIAAGLKTVKAAIAAKGSFTARSSGVVRKRLGQPNAGPKKVEAARRELAKGTGVLRTAKLVGLGTRTVQRLKQASVGG